MGWTARVGIAVVGLGLVGNGLAALFNGSAFYPNYWGGAVFAPISPIIGAVVVLVAIFQGRMRNEESGRRERKHHH